MNSRGWILALPAGADKHHSHLCECASSLKKRRIGETDESPSESSEVDSPGVVKKARKNGVSVDVLTRGRHILKDLVNDTN
jgi:hypothetical protein